jgi:hypothetical protein
VHGLLQGTAADATPLERALIQLVRKAYACPARLGPRDLDPVRELAGDGALQYVLVIAAFHWFNRIADLLGVDLEVLPRSLRRFEFLRRLAVRAGGRLLKGMDLANRPYQWSYEEVVSRVAPLLESGLGGRAAQELAPLRSHPHLIEILHMALEERDGRTSLDRTVLATVYRTVEEALPASEGDLSGFPARSTDPVVDFVFVGTRYAYRTTSARIDALRRSGHDDLGILDLATAVADANLWARMFRLLGLRPSLFYLRAAAG